MPSSPRSRSLVFALLVHLVFLGPAVAQEDEPLLWTNPEASGEVLAEWTPERSAAVRPMPFPGVARSVVERLQAGPEGEVGSAKAHFTSSRLVPLEADLVYPYRAVGRIEFGTPGGDAHCSGALIKPRVVLTAGHCVHKGSGGNAGFYSAFVFKPGYRDGIAPFGTWEAEAVLVTTTWAAGNARLPNAADYALLVLADNPRRAGDVVGWLGFALNRLTPNHVTMLGYPFNLDGGEKMHQVTAASFRAGAKKENIVFYGSDMMQGSSGGPWIQNFGASAEGRGPGGNPAVNTVVGVTSFGSTSAGPKVAASSILDNRLIGLLNAACTVAPGTC